MICSARTSVDCTTSIDRDLTTRFLLEHAYTVLTAKDGMEALEVAERHRDPIHVLLTDVVMPILSGWQLARQVTAIHPEVRVLYMTGYTEVPVAPSGAVLQKPFTPFALLQVVSDVLDRSEPAPAPTSV